MRGTTWASPGTGPRVGARGWRGQRVFLRVGSANYAARVWVNGHLVAEHLGGHLPFVAEITAQLVWDRENVIAIAVENKQLPERVPAGPSPAGGLFSGFMGSYPAPPTTSSPMRACTGRSCSISVPAVAHRRRHGA